MIRTVHAISLAIGHPEHAELLLLVRRPPDDPELPGVWGLPAASRRPGEKWRDAARRAARDKLGVGIEGLRTLRDGSTNRDAYRLRMRLAAARIANGEPTVPQPVTGVTQYTDWQWGPADSLLPAARLGSLCCRLQLEVAGLWPTAPEETRSP